LISAAAVSMLEAEEVMPAMTPSWAWALTANSREARTTINFFISVI